MAPQPEPPRITHIILRISDAHIYHGHTRAPHALRGALHPAHLRCDMPAQDGRIGDAQDTRPPNNASEMRKMGNLTCMHVGYAKTPSHLLRISDAHIYHGHTRAPHALRGALHPAHLRCDMPAQDGRIGDAQDTRPPNNASEMRKMGNPTCMHVGHAKTPFPLLRVGDAQEYLIQKKSALPARTGLWSTSAIFFIEYSLYICGSELSIIP